MHGFFEWIKTDKTKAILHPQHALKQVARYHSVLFVSVRKYDHYAIKNNSQRDASQIHLIPEYPIEWFD